MTVMESVFRNPAFLQAVEDHLPYFLANGRYINRSVDPALSLAFMGDFNGLLMNLNIPLKYAYVSMRLSGLQNPTDYTGHEVTFKLVDMDYFNLFANTWKAHNRAK